jgi:hypothetical protein
MRSTIWRSVILLSQTGLCNPAGAVLDVLCNVFATKSACIAISDHQEKALFWDGKGICGQGTHSSWAQQFVTWTLTGINNEIIIVEDASKDAR